MMCTEEARSIIKYFSHDLRCDMFTLMEKYIIINELKIIHLLRMLLNEYYDYKLYYYTLHILLLLFIFLFAKVLKIYGSAQEAFEKFDKDKDNRISSAELSALLIELECTVNNQQLKHIMSELDTNEDGVIDFEEFSRWYLTSEQRIQSGRKLFHNYDK